MDGSHHALLGELDAGTVFKTPMGQRGLRASVRLTGVPWITAAGSRSVEVPRVLMDSCTTPPRKR